jgi:hypothetical protein
MTAVVALHRLHRGIGKTGDGQWYRLEKTVRRGWLYDAVKVGPVTWKPEKPTPHLLEIPEQYEASISNGIRQGAG